MQRILNTGTVPHGGVWRYRDEETALVIAHPYLDKVRGLSHRHRIVNNLPIPVNWEEMFEDNICRNTPTALCGEADTGLRRALALAGRFTAAMVNWTRSGFKFVDDDTLAARRLACEGDATHERCSAWENRRQGFTFGRCGKCGCSGFLKTPLASERCPLGRWDK